MPVLPAIFVEFSVSIPDEDLLIFSSDLSFPEFIMGATKEKDEQNWTTGQTTMWSLPAKRGV